MCSRSPLLVRSYFSIVLSVHKLSPLAYGLQPPRFLCFRVFWLSTDLKLFFSHLFFFYLKIFTSVHMLVLPGSPSFLFFVLPQEFLAFCGAVAPPVFLSHSISLPFLLSAPSGAPDKHFTHAVVLHYLSPGL